MKNENGTRYEDEAPRYERDRSASPRPTRRNDSPRGGPRRSASPDRNGRADERSGPKNDRGPGPQDDGAVNPGSNLFVTGIHPRLLEEEVSRLFEKYGDVEKCQIMRDPHTRESRGFGFVKMITSDQADAAKEGLQGEVIEGRTLSIEKARRARPRTPTLASTLDHQREMTLVDLLVVDGVEIVMMIVVVVVDTAMNLMVVDDMVAEMTETEATAAVIVTTTMMLPRGGDERRGGGYQDRDRYDEVVVTIDQLETRLLLLPMVIQLLVEMLESHMEVEPTMMIDIPTTQKKESFGSATFIDAGVHPLVLLSRFYSSWSKASGDGGNAKAMRGVTTVFRRISSDNIRFLLISFFTTDARISFIIFRFFRFDGCVLPWDISLALFDQLPHHLMSSLYHYSAETEFSSQPICHGPTRLEALIDFVRL
ncbi:hypothetical protein DID88_007441 [Monilinia fructigena]|uniref:RRM domain-containing protein n=1 Tax=Monilinia fructigena TaxID=38457 RepID=A0A395J935_9HELO|nr:hypothetical protein DID88_007441 [Monilinia fructigena]